MKVKRLVALLMALIMVVGLFAMTASAVSGVHCYACSQDDKLNTTNTYISYGNWVITNSWNVSGCGKGWHTHADMYRTVYKNCRVHGLIDSYTESRSNVCV